MLSALAGGNRVPVIAQLVQAKEDAVRDVIHRFDEIGLACLDPHRAGGRPRLLDPDDEDFVTLTATTRPTSRSPVGQSANSPSACAKSGVASSAPDARRYGAWSPAASITFQRTKTGKEPPDPDRVTKLDRMSTSCSASRNACSRSTSSARSVSALHWRLVLGSCRSPRAAPRDPPPHPRRQVLPRLLLDRRRHPVGRRPPQEGRREHPGRIYRSICAARPDGAPANVILDHLSAHEGEMSRPRARKNSLKLCFTPTYASWTNTVEARFGPLRQFTAAANGNHCMRGRCPAGPSSRLDRTARGVRFYSEALHRPHLATADLCLRHLGAVTERE
ncbi:helix-turn-helix domain-containing protein [Streptomyces sp. NPDC093228]|uniref:helix-turn-helix domain-containing protein n=1 Tax=Streptomyces sp. NPDC093228 TaxID=3155070 RepID=UPI00343352B7